MISGHRRLHAAGIVGLKKIPAIVRDLDDDEAVIAMVNANLQREEILPSERGFSLKMKMDAMRHQGTCRHDVDKLSPVERKTATIVGEGSGLTGRSVQRYIRLTELIALLNDALPEKMPCCKVALSERKLDKYFPPHFSARKREEIILMLLAEWKEANYPEVAE